MTVHAQPAGSASEKLASDSLADCLVLAARAHGRTLSAESARAGLPLVDGVLSPALLPRAAARAGLAARVLAQPLQRLTLDLAPIILLLHNEHACLLVGRNETTGAFKVVYPELGDAVIEVAADELAARYLGRAVYLRPKHRFDARSPLVSKRTSGHWFWGVMAENRRLYRDVLLAALLINLFALALPLFTMNVYDRVVPNSAFDTLHVLAAGVFLMLVGDLLLRSLRGYFVDLAGARADVTLSASIMERVLGTRMEHKPASVGSFASNLRAFESVRDFTSSATVLAFIDVPFALLFLLVIGFIAPMLVVPLVVAMLMLLGYALLIQGRMQQLAETTYRASAQRNATLVEGLVALEAVKTLGAESTLQRRWEQSAWFLARVGAQLRLLSSSSSNGALWVQQTTNVVLVIIGVYLISDNQLTMGGLIACSMLSGRALAPMSQVAGLLVQYHTAATSLKSLDKLMTQEVERPDDASFVSRPVLQGSIEFRNVSFQYPGQQTPALRGVSLSIAPGEKVAVLGRVGSGKTSLEKLILGLYRPQEGAILIDGIDLRQLDPAELRRNIGHVAQDVTLFYGSLRDNLSFAHPLVDDEAIVKAAEVAGILPFVNSHPQGFDMLVGERGDTVSGGQRQGIGIARALIHDPPVLLLDEPTSSMDHSSEAELKQRLRDWSVGKTMLLITHRTSLLDLVDRVVVLDAGRVVADGPKAQVLEALRQGRIGRAAA